MGRPRSARHGTTSGYKRHKLDNETPCDACTRAQVAYDARRRQIPEQKLKAYIRARAQNRALSTMAHRYPEEYREEYQIELLLAQEEAESYAGEVDS